jgi:hypothetical protein
MIVTQETIRIGDTYTAQYTFYNPLPGTSEPDLTSPINLTGITISWHLQNRGTVHDFATGSGVTVTPLLGLIEIEIADSVTANWLQDEDAVKYLKFVYADGDEKTKAHGRARIVKRETY